ncbi:hypothetical protein ABFT80_04570 [Mesorhizobium sp. SB112]|uniref:hypothetical protein n=1 Tax=Mesorhizobium sp. SB112 TaxID=3151853 RepID=UPI0032669D02
MGLVDQLEAFSRAVDFDLFRQELETALSYSDGSRDGRPPIDPVRMAKVGSIGPLFERFDTMLRDSGYIPVSGQIVAASLVAAPRQRNTKEEKAGIKAGKIPEA